MNAQADVYHVGMSGGRDDKFGVGSHLVTLQLEDDELPSDNRQDFAVEVLPTVPVLIVSNAAADGKTRTGDFLRDALAPAKDPTPAFAVRTVPFAEWSTAMFAADVKGNGTPPRVVVLANVDKLTGGQQQDLEKFLTAGGSVLVTLGDRCDAAAWNRVAFRGGQGFSRPGWWTWWATSRTFRTPRRC